MSNQITVIEPGELAPEIALVVVEPGDEKISYNQLAGVAGDVLEGLGSKNSVTVYRPALNDFLRWWELRGRPALSRALIESYRNEMQAQGLAASTINLRLSAVRTLVARAVDEGVIQGDQAIVAQGVQNAGGVKSRGVRTGNWLTKDQAQALINAPDTSTLKGLRDRAILAVMVGTGLRRSEVANLTFEQIQLREARWVVVDLVGKGGRVRSVPMPAWCKAAIDEWAEAAGISSGHVFQGFHRFSLTLRVMGGGVDGRTIYNAVVEHGEQLGLNIRPHDLRRTYAKLARRGGAALDQIQLSLGHASIQTTERYLGVAQDLQDAPCDYLGLKI